jgi:hypothetical protein
VRLFLSFFAEEHRLEGIEADFFVVRVWSAAFELWGALLWHRLTHFYLGKEAKKAALRGWYEAHLPIGVHPFRTVWTYERFVGASLSFALLSPIPIFRSSLLFVLLYDARTAPE